MARQSVDSQCVGRGEGTTLAVMAREWDAETYAALALPHAEWGQRVLDRMQLVGTETVLDAGCGTGRDAAALRARWPDLQIVALDGSTRMLDVARGALSGAGGSVRFVHADLTEPLPIAPVDAVMSVAAFHWVTDHTALFATLAAAMKPGARLTSDCGGRGNVTNLEAAIARVTGKPATDVEFADEAETRERLTAAGFEVEDVRLRPSPLRIEDPDIMENYLAVVCLGGQLTSVAEDEQAAFVREIRLAFDEPVVDYVRLEIDATRS